ncbi:hypothetical protein GUJ93_ZPchr0010g10788 [Zizania palustris]|uniref:Uncharacterized protein n=1 Tax=Zizania palustris TaxID=103762 RepID=A0A8J5W8C2_ZIZPA|nr:hypothetical protein GUJ93_ZPchr0010g10788 [Zizania palustris]
MDVVSKSKSTTAGCGADPAPRPPRTQKPSDARVQPSEAEQAGGELLHHACCACLRLACARRCRIRLCPDRTLCALRPVGTRLCRHRLRHPRRALRRPPPRRASHAGVARLERRLLLLAAWALSTALSCGFAYRIARSCRSPWPSPCGP